MCCLGRHAASDLALSSPIVSNDLQIGWEGAWHVSGPLLGAISALAMADTRLVAECVLSYPPGC
jgi:hypothetical protein